MRNTDLMSEEGKIHDNTDLSNNEEEIISTEPETEPVAPPALEPEPEVEIISSVREKSGIEEAATEQAIREQIHPPDVEQPQVISRTKPKKLTINTSIMKIQRLLADSSKQIEKQTTQINKINQNLQSLQKHFKSGQRQSELVNQIRSQVNQIQKQISQVQKSVQRK